MKTRLLIAAFVIWNLFAAAAAHAVSAEPLDMDERTLAKLARARAKGHATSQSQSQDKQDKRDASCDVNVGNTINTRPGNTPKEIIVVVQGDVINSNNKCK